MLGNGFFNAEKYAGRYTKLVGSFGRPKLILQLSLLEMEIPARATAEVLESGNRLQMAQGITAARQAGAVVIVSLASAPYALSAPEI
jgi:hypothetical protein